MSKDVSRRTLLGYIGSGFGYAAVGCHLSRATSSQPGPALRDATLAWHGFDPATYNRLPLVERAFAELKEVPQWDDVIRQGLAIIAEVVR